MSQRKNKAKWLYKDKEIFTVPKEAIGFVYAIEILGTNLYYYGKKNLFSTSGRGKKKVVKESNWRTYESSSKEVKQLIKDGAEIRKEILMFCYSKAELSLEETKAIICSGALRDPDSLNRWVTLKVWEHQLKK